MTMPLFLTATLGVSIAGLTALFAAKRYELTTGRVVFGGMRPKIGAAFHAVLVWFEQVLPARTNHFVREAMAAGRWLLHHGAARAVLAAEVWLERALLRLRRATGEPVQHAAGEASVFLREVAEHKRKLLKRSSRAPRAHAQ